ncbi:MAG: hypothetical protein MUP55_02640 [Candidatus Aenigmarchaeota archaeon]|nr:hypothetical protein [Candidatus Aenigmarchaeota archaeon]
MDKKLLALVLTTAAVVIGLILEPSGGSPSIARYIISDVGEFLVILVAALIGFERAKSFSFRSGLGKALFFISLGLLAWGAGILSYSYYNIIMQIEVPYPSLADIGFLGIIPLAAYGLFWLLKSIKITFDKKTILKVTALPLVSFLFTYWLFIQTKLAEDVSLIEKILNVAYPMGDVVFLSLTFVILSLIRGGNLFKPIAIICAGFIIEAIADFSFSWTTATGTYYTGSFPDVLFALAFFTIGLGMYYTKQMAEIPAVPKKKDSK